MTPLQKDPDLTAIATQEVAALLRSQGLTPADAAAAAATLSDHSPTEIPPALADLRRAARRARWYRRAVLIGVAAALLLLTALLGTPLLGRATALRAATALCMGLSVLVILRVIFGVSRP